MARKTPATGTTANAGHAPRRKKIARTGAEKSPTVASQLPTLSAAQIQAAKEKYERGIMARGEAVEAGKSLPPGATHEITGRSPEGSPILKRRRFSAV